MTEIEQHLRRIHEAAAEIKRSITIMEICGGHTNVIMKHGLRGILPRNVRLVSGPGCPVCVSPQHDLDCMIELATSGIPVATYGDMIRVRGSRCSLEDAKSRGAAVHEVYSAEEVVELRKKLPNIVFFGVGFETTAPMTAFLLERRVPVYSVHRLIPACMKSLCNGAIKIDGFINPGHVSAIIGAKAYREIKMPQVIAGFTAERVVRALSSLVEMIRDGGTTVVNAYPEAVQEHGNTKAQMALEKHFYAADSEWRGLGTIKSSGLEVREEALNAKILHGDLLNEVQSNERTDCRCGDVLKGLIEPSECRLYGKPCTPSMPQGACMVSAEGSCGIAYKYGDERRR
jgi:hydrogenase expression/formation protein HypD